MFIFIKIIAKTTNSPCISFCALSDCADETMKVYGASYTFRIQPQTEYVEFEPLHSSEELMVLWNRSDSQVHKDRLHVKWNKAKITHITQANAGYYNLRRKDNSLLARELLKVEGEYSNKQKLHVYLI